MSTVNGFCVTSEDERKKIVTAKHNSPGIKIMRFLRSTLGWLIFIPGYVDFYITE